MRQFIVITMIDKMSKGINSVLKIGADFAEAKGQSIKHYEIKATDGKIDHASFFNDIGIGIRVFYRGGVGLSFTNVIDKRHIAETAKAALKLAKVSAERMRKKPDWTKECEHESDSLKAHLDVKKHPENVEEEEKKELCLRICRSGFDFSKHITSVTSGYAELYGKVYYTNLNIESSYETLLLGLKTESKARKMGSTADSYEEAGGSFGFESFVKERSPETLAQNAAEWSIKKLDATKAPRGRFPAIIDPKLGGNIVHECFGHLAEADMVMAESSSWGDKIDKLVGSQIITMVDEGICPYGGFYMPFDDEGISCKRTEILKNGLLTSYLHSRETACFYRAKSTGNARSQDYSHEPIVRMRNTYLANGDWELEELVRETREGVYARDVVAGHVVNGSFVFKAPRGFLIERGEYKKVLKDLTISGSTNYFLKNIDAVCNDLRLDAFPWFNCLKAGQQVPVGTGAPHFRVKQAFFGMVI
jgi:TldD protein